MKVQRHPTNSIQDQRMIDHKAAIMNQRQLRRADFIAVISAVIALVSLIVSLVK